jgi:HEAT repeat protein
VFEQGLRALLVDPDRLVRVRAAGSLAILGDATMLEEASGDLRRGRHERAHRRRQKPSAASAALGQPLLVRIVGEVGPQAAPIRAAALETMARTGNKDCARILQFYMLHDAYAGVQQAAETALVSMSSGDALQVLADALQNGSVEGPKRARLLSALGMFDGAVVRETLGRFLEDADVHVVDQAALGLRARRRRRGALPRRDPPPSEEPLRQARSTPSRSSRAPRCSCRAQANADQYELWYRAHGKVGDRAWYRDALTRRGYDATALERYVQGDADRKGVPVLLKALRDEDAVIRRNADVALRRISGISFGRLERNTPRDEAAAIADRWVDWWSRQPEAPR